VLSLRLKLKSKLSSVLVGVERGRRSRSFLRAWRSTSSCSSIVRKSTNEDCCSTAWPFRASEERRRCPCRRLAVEDLVTFFVDVFSHRLYAWTGWRRPNGLGSRVGQGRGRAGGHRRQCASEGGVDPG